MGKNQFTIWSVALYGFVLFMAAAAWYILSRSLIKRRGNKSDVAKVPGSDRKEKRLSLLYAIALFVCFLNTRTSLILYVPVAVIRFVPDRRVGRKLLF